LETALQESAERSTTLEAALQGKEEQRAALETALQESEERSTALEASLQEKEEQRAALETALQESGERSTALEASLQEKEEQRATLETSLQESGERSTALEASLQESEESRKQQAKVFDAERSRWEQTRQEWEEKLREAEERDAANLQSAIREVEDRYGRIREENQEKDAQLEQIGLDLQQLKEDIENLESELSAEKLRYRRVSQISSVGIVVTTMEGRVLECNDSAARLFGYTGAEDALSQTEEGKSFRIFAFQGSLGERLRREGRLENIEWSSLSRDGRLIRLQEDALLVEDPAGDSPRIERVLTDITRIYELSEEIRRIRKVESTGDFLAAAVKNLKNICESLAESSKLLKDNPDDRNIIQKVAETLLKDANRGSKNVRQFLSISAKTERVPTVVNLCEILTDNDAVLHSLVGENIDLQIHSSLDGSLITADRQETIKLISNLVVSSMKTLPLGGTVSIDTENIEIDASSSEYPDNIPSGTFVLMTISADGCEVLPERRMSFNKSVMDRIGGWIFTTNDPQTGNVHRLYFPRVESFAGTILEPDTSEPESSD
jgi:PAS domain S-box-containing protein